MPGLLDRLTTVLPIGTGRSLLDMATKPASYRAGMIPYAEYQDGSAGWGYPQMLPDAFHAMEHIRDGKMPTNQEAALLAGFAMTGGGFGSLASKAVSGRALEDVAASNGLRSSPVEAGSGPVSARVYRGSMDHETWPPTADAHGRSVNDGAFWASDNPDVANVYSNLRGPEDVPFAFEEGLAPNVTPADITFHNPMIIDAAGREWHDLPGDHRSPYYAAKAAKERGNDGLVIRNVYDDGPLGTTYAALRPGTVRSATTGETLFSNPKEAAPVGLIAGGSKPQTIRAYHGTNESFDTFDPSKTKEVGFHFGSKEAADARSVAKNGPLAMPWPLGKGWRTIPVDIEANKIADISHDPAGFGGYVLAKQLVEDGIAPPEVLKEATRLHVRDYGKGDLSASRDYVRNWLTSNGYDVVRYPNTYEGGGHSYMTMGTGNVRHAKSGATLFANPKEAAPVGMVAYRGADKPHQFPPPDDVRTFWASSDPAVSENYTNPNSPDSSPQIMPAEMRFANPAVVDAQGRSWADIHPTSLPDNWPGPYHAEYSTDTLARKARDLGHDGLVIRNVVDSGPAATTYAALRPGTVFSPLTGEQLFSNAPEAAAAGTVGLLPPDKRKGRSRGLLDR